MFEKPKPHILAFVQASSEWLFVGRMLKYRREIFEGQRATKMGISEAIRSASSEYYQKLRKEDPKNIIQVLKFQLYLPEVGANILR